MDQGAEWTGMGKGLLGDLRSPMILNGVVEPGHSPLPYTSEINPPLTIPPFSPTLGLWINLLIPSMICPVLG